MTFPRREFIWTHDYIGAQTGVLSAENGLSDFRREERYGQSETLYFTIRADDPKAALILDDAEVRWRDRRYFVFEQNKRRDGSQTFVDVEAPATWARLAEDKRVGTLELKNLTIPAGIAAIIDGSTWTAGLDDVGIDLVSTFSLTASDASVLDLLRKWAKITTTEISFDTGRQRVSFVRQVGADRGLAFRYGRNVITIDRRSNPPAATRLYPYGRDGLDITALTAGNVPYLDDFSFYTAAGLTLGEAQARFLREEVWSDTSFVSDVDLLAGARARLALAAQPFINYTLAVVDLAEITGTAEDEVAIGDTVRATDDPLGFDVVTRVVRLCIYPLEPARSEVELSYLPLPVPDPSVNSSRADSALEWILFADRNETTARSIRQGRQIVNHLDLSTTADAQWILGYSLVGTGVGTGTITLELVDVLSGDLMMPTQTIAVTPGSAVRLAWTFGDLDIVDAGWRILARINSSGSSVGVDIAENGTALWVLAKGTTQKTAQLPNSIRYDHVPSIQTFTVPDDITEITIEAHGAEGNDTGGTAQGGGGKGGRVVAAYNVTAGTVFDVYVGGRGSSSTGGWPNGGDSPSGGSIRDGGAGGGSSHVVPQGSPVSAAIIVAAGGGGDSGSNSGSHGEGGDGGFLNGIAGTSDGASTAGGGASQTAGGTAGAFGNPGTAMQGGDGGTASFSNAGGGGGGGGWFGGGGGEGPATGLGAGGGGGSGWVTESMDLDYTDGENVGDGYVIISWTTPLAP